MPVRRLRPSHAVGWLGAFGLGAASMAWATATWTDAALPALDASITVASLIAQWLMGRKILESWAIWIAVDVLSVGVYASRGLYPTMLLYAVFLGLATAGLLRWRADLRRLA